MEIQCPFIVNVENLVISERERKYNAEEII